MRTSKTKLSKSIRFIIAASAAASVVSVSPVFAQEVNDDDNSFEKIAVVGSRAAPRSIADSPVPIDIIGADELSKSGNTDMLEILKGTVPSLNVHSNPISDAASLVRPANLRGLPADSTLILLNGKRRHRSSVIAFLGGGINDGAQGPDISVIPSIAIKQVEVLRDGAAAQYGSDAIAGVMNFVLKDDSDGGTLSVRRGEYYEGDGASTEVSGNIGMPLTQDGFANVSFQYKNADATSRSVQRPDAAAFAVAGLDVANPAQIWGSPEVNDDITIFGNVGLDLGNDKEFYMFGNYSERDVRGGFYYRNPNTRGGVYGGNIRDVEGVATRQPADLDKDVITSEEAAYNAATPTILVGSLEGFDQQLDCPIVEIGSNGLPNQTALDSLTAANCFAFNQSIPGGFTPNFGGNITDTSLTIGTKGEFKDGFADGVLYDLSGTVGRSESQYVIYNTVNASLGPNTPRDFRPGKYIQLEKNFNFDLVKLVDAGLYEDVNVAGGLEWHEESYEIVAGDVASYTAGPLTTQGFGIGSNGFPGFKPNDAGVSTRRNYAAYVDMEAQVTEALLLGGALRFEDYDTFGSTTNYKISAQFHLTDELSIRSSISSGFRAPTVGQANVSNVQTNLDGGVLVDSALLAPTNPISVQLGGTELQPEESDSYTLGGVYQDGDFFMTVDYYHIEVSDRLSQSDKINLTAEDKDALRAIEPNIDSFQQVSFFTNDFDTTTQGIDVVANYSADLLDGSSTFSLAYNWNDTEVTKFSEITGAFKVKRLEEDLPNHRATFTWSQSWEDISMFTRANYYGEYQGVHVDYDATAITASSAVTVDFEVSYMFSDSITISVGAQNVFDQEAERVQQTAGLDAEGLPKNNWGGVYYETSPMGFNGGLYYISANYNF
ncbi:TonB-dependent receptor plug domain-containing protein [Paraglaciecola psychrophila]|jgi:iron complex outermembrane receptor protein|uniref:TonB-dependent outer membrane receptor n=1 Tax=Paraglaciecola psychrophila 170 TaxID=1129794 RepID=K7ALY3_9ALTE|nr:TonB-dependent receptor [Paraglaciecola psychrophila]AGH45062.1 TonB-dependent outer membrane receptor [Paraglaciecola psychrophila 170]GAC36405.1 iron complex outermembrane recepter protein [Paraglaciecola psychrophila 170]